MAIKTNTSKNIGRTSEALGAKCEETKANMAQMMRRAGCTKYETEETVLPLIPGCRDDVVFVGLNGVGFYFKRGEKAALPKPLLEIMKSCDVV